MCIIEPTSCGFCADNKRNMTLLHTACDSETTACKLVEV